MLPSSASPFTAEAVPVLLVDVVDELVVKLLINDAADAPPPEP